MDWEQRTDGLDEHQQFLVQQLAMMRKMRRTVIDDTGFHYVGREDFLLQHGEWFTAEPWTYKGMEGEPKTCFNHSAILCHVHDGFEYVEGVAFRGDLPLAIEHAWAINSEGRLVDGVWRNGGLAYLGVRFPLRMVTAALKHGCPVLDNYVDRYKLYRKPWTLRKRSAHPVHKSRSAR